MNQYDFNVLSWEEFEEFTKDILTAEMGIEFESFANGPDMGIDLRYSLSRNKRDIIVQCKHYKTASSLLKSLKKERAKIDKMAPKPKRYILSLSLDLREDKINEIVNLFAPYIKKPSDILCPKALNSMLSRHEVVERRHYKLWLSSSNVLRTILSSQVKNYTSLIKEEIKDTLRLYSPTPSFGDAMNALKDNGFIIIAGQPGVGKTTLANVMSYHLLGNNDFDELIALPQDIHQAVEMMSANPEKKQLFLFDDFLGSNYLDQKLSRHEDSVFRTLIKHIKHLKKNKALIMTTREYILHQAQQSADIFKDDDFLKAEYIINLSKYDVTTKAKILYNHIAASDIPPKYLAYFVGKKVYHIIIKHKSYSPRLIESINKQRLWKERTPEAFCDKLIYLFDHPWSLYEDVFENKIGQAERDVLLVMMSIGTSILFEHLHRAVVSFNEKYTEIDLKKAIEVLDGTFLHTSENKDDKIVVSFLNPTIQDFLLHYFKTHHYTLQRLIKSAVYLNQIVHPFAVNKSSATAAFRSAAGYSEPILVNAENKIIIETKIIDSWGVLRWINTGGAPEEFDLFSNVSRLLDDAIVTDKIKEALFGSLVEYLKCKARPTQNVYAAIDLFDNEYDPYDMPKTVLENYTDSIADSVLGYEDFATVAEFGQGGVIKKKLSNIIIDKIIDRVDCEEFFTQEISERLSNSASQDDIRHEFTGVTLAYGLNYGFVDSVIDAWVERHEDYDGSQFYSKNTDFESDEQRDFEDGQDKIVDDVFQSLLIV